MKVKRLFSVLTLACLLPLAAMATIVDGVRQKPTYTTQGFVTNQEVYMLNVGSGQFFTQGNSWQTQASVGTEPRLVKFVPNSATDYTMLCYCWRNNDLAAGWRNVFFDSETALFVDRNNQANYFFAVEDNGSTFRLGPSNNDPQFVDYVGAGLYVGLPKSGTTTALSPFVDADEAYVDWSFVTKEAYESLSGEIAIYEKAQELKSWIDRITAENGDASSLNSIYLNEGSTMDELQAAIDQAQTIYIQALINNATDKENVDVTMALKNPNYEEGENGWTVEAASGTGPNGRQGNVRPGGSADNQCYEAWNNAKFDIYQTLQGMPIGVYEIEVQGFYRYWRGDNAWNAYQQQNVDYVKPNGVPVYIYLNNNATNFTNVFGDPKQITNETFYSIGSSDYSSHTQNGATYYFPNGMASAAIAFSDGMYKQSAFGLIANEGDPFRIGVKGNSNQQNDSWVIWDNFKLYYRGFKAEVVKPVLETAMADLNQYATMLMGKTEFATLSTAFADAEKAIADNNGEAMFKALNDLYNVKESVIASKDLFLDREVPADTTRLAESIADTNGKKLYKGTLEAAQTLLAAIKGNTKYEGTEIDQLKSDVTAAIEAINNSLVAYANLNEAVTAVRESVTKKAYQTLIDEANELLTTASTGYEACSLTDTEATTLTQNLWTKQEALTASIAAYITLAEAIARLQAAITEASAETQHVAQSTLKKANLRLTASQKLYDEGTIATADIEARVKVIDELITELTRSIELYKQFAAGLEELAAALAKEDKVAAQTLESATQLYTTAKQAYDEGTIDDEAVEAKVNELAAAVKSLAASAELYKSLAEAIPTLEEAVKQKANRALLDEATALLANTTDGYEKASIVDANIPALIETINTKAEAVNASAAEYAKLKAAIDRLAAAIEEVGETATKSALKKANLRLTASQKLYDEGTIADADIAARVTAIDELIEELTASVRLRKQYDEAIAKLDAAVTAAKDKVNEVMLTNATTLQTAIKKDYDEGNVADADVPAEIAKIENIVAALQTAPAAYQLANQKLQEIEDAADKLKEALEKIAAAEAKANEADLVEPYREQAAKDIAAARVAIDQLKADNEKLKMNVDSLVAVLNAVALTDGSDPVNNIKSQLEAIDANAIVTSANELVATTERKIQEDIDGSIATNIQGLRYVDDGAVWYDLSGHKLAGKPVRKGIYIRNGKRVTVK